MVEEKLDLLIKQVAEMQKIQCEQGKIQSEQGEVQRKIQQDVLSMKLTLEQEIRPNIITIAEGHLDLSRKLDDALKIKNEEEIMKIRLNILENDVRKIKEVLKEC